MAGVSSLYPGYSSVKALPRERKNGQIHNSFCPPAAGGDRVLSMDVTSVAWARPLHPDRPWLRPGSGSRFTAAFTRGGGRRGGGDRVRGRGLGARGGNQPRPRLLPTQTRSRVEARHRRGRARGCDSGRAGLCRLPGCACGDPVRRLLPRASRFPESLAVSPHGLRRLLRHRPGATGASTSAAGHRHFRSHLCRAVSLGLTWGSSPHKRPVPMAVTLAAGRPPPKKRMFCK